MSKHKNSHLKLCTPIAKNSKLIVIGDDESLLKKAKTFALTNNLILKHYTEEDWATLEEIDQYIQEEDISKQVINLPFGASPIALSSQLEERRIKQSLKRNKQSLTKLAKKMKITRAILYKKLELYSLKNKKTAINKTTKIKIQLRKVA